MIELRGLNKPHKIFADYIWCIAKNNMKPWRNPNQLTNEQLKGLDFTCQLLGTPNPYAN